MSDLAIEPRAATGLHTLLALALAAVAPGCHRVDYRGDGVLTIRKAPVWFCQDQIDVELGGLDLSNQVHVERVIDGLPPGEYVVGFDVRTLEVQNGLRDSVRGGRSPNLAFALGLRNERGEEVFSATGPLAGWTWSGGLASPDAAFAYRRGKAREVRVSASLTQSQREGVGADGGWGSYFTARRGGRYTLVLDTAAPFADADRFDVALRVRGVVGCL